MPSSLNNGVEVNVRCFASYMVYFAGFTNFEVRSETAIVLHACSSFIVKDGSSSGNKQIILIKKTQIILFCFYWNICSMSLFIVSQPSDTSRASTPAPCRHVPPVYSPSSPSFLLPVMCGGVSAGTENGWDWVSDSSWGGREWRERGEWDGQRLTVFSLWRRGCRCQDVQMCLEHVHTCAGSSHADVWRESG